MSIYLLKEQKLKKEKLIILVFNKIWYMRYSKITEIRDFGEDCEGWRRKWIEAEGFSFSLRMDLQKKRKIERES